MRWLIRRVLKKGKGAVSYEEDVHYGDVLTIGRAADQAIFLPDLRVALNHATTSSRHCLLLKKRAMFSARTSFSA